MKKFVLLLRNEVTLFSVVVFWLSLASISFIFLADDSDDGSIFSERFGEITYTQSSVRRKRSAKYRWYDIGAQSVVAKNDSIKTGPASAAVVKLDSGNLLELGENSLVILKDQESISSNFIQGSLIIRSDKGDKQISVDEKGNKIIEELSFRWLEPLLSQEYVVAPNQKANLKFAWKKTRDVGLSADQKVFLEISRSPNMMSDSTQKYLVDVNKGVHQLALSYGTYFYRLVNEQAKALTEPRSLRLHELEALTPTSLALNTFEDITSPLLSWKVPSKLSTLYAEGKHQLEISDDSSFSKNVQGIEINPISGEHLVSSLATGNYYLRIKSQLKGFSYVGETAQLTIQKISKSKVTLLSPTPYSNYPLQAGLSIDWTMSPKVSDPLKYKVEVTRLGQRVSFQETTDEYYYWPNTSEGSFEVKIIAEYRSQVISESDSVPFSVGRSVGLALLKPTNLRILEAWPKSKVEFSWEKNIKNAVKNYRLEIAKDYLFSDLKIKQDLKDIVHEVSFQNLEESSYYWRVVAVLEDEKEVISNTHSFKYQLPPLLSKINPRDLKKEYVLSENKKPILKWKAIDGAVAYEVEILKANGRSPASYSSQALKAAMLSLPKLSEGSYKIRLWPIDQASRRGELFEGQFDIKYGKLLRAPKLNKPEVE